MVRVFTRIRNAPATTAWMVDEDAVLIFRACHSIRRSFLLVVCRSRPEPVRQCWILSCSQWSQHILTIPLNGSGDAQTSGKTILFSTVQWCGLSQTLLAVRIAVEWIIGTSLSVTGTHKHVCKRTKICPINRCTCFYLTPWQRFSALYVQYDFKACSQIWPWPVSKIQSFACFQMIDLYSQFWRPSFPGALIFLSVSVYSYYSSILGISF